MSWRQHLRHRADRPRSRVLATATLGLLLVLGTVTGAFAASPVGQVSTYPIPTASSYPFFIAAGPDGDLWFTENDGNKVGKITTTGTITEYPTTTANSSPAGITAGPDGNVWFAENGANQIAKITPTGTVTEYPVTTAVSGPEGITTGPDGNLWFTEYSAGQIGKITPAGAVTEFPIPTTGSEPDEIVTGPDGNLWFTEAHSDQIGRITPSGTVTEYPVPTPKAFPSGIAAGPDGNIWFTEEGANNVGKITTSGTVTEYPTPQTSWRIAAGPDGNLWFTTGPGNHIDQITPTGTVTSYGASGQLGGITAGPDGNMWFTEETGNAIGSIGTQSASGQPVASVNPSSHDFGSVAPGQTSQPLLVAVKNVGQAPLTVSGAQLTGAQASAFAISADHCSGQTLQPGTACEIDVTYSPASESGYSASLAISDNASDSPQNVTLTGTTPTDASAAPTNIDFGPVTAGQTSASRSVTVTNTGGAPLDVSNAQITGPQASAFAIASDQCLGQSIQPGGSCSIGVTFAPESGSYAATLTIADNTGSSPQQVALSGTTQARPPPPPPPTAPPRASFSPSSLDFEAVGVGQSGVRTVSVSNTGGAPLNVGNVSIGGQDPSAFAVVANNCSGHGFSGSGYCTIDVRFAPTADSAYAATLLIADDASDSPQEVQLAGHGSPRGAIAGHVVDTELGNQPLAGATVEAYLGDCKYCIDIASGAGYETTKTDATGGYSLANLGVGKWRLQVTSADGKLAGSGIATVSGGEVTNQDFALYPPRPLSGGMSFVGPSGVTTSGVPVVGWKSPFSFSVPLHIPGNQPPDSSRLFAVIAGLGSAGGGPSGSGFNIAGVLLFNVGYNTHGQADRMSSVVLGQVDCGPTGSPSPCGALAYLGGGRGGAADVAVGHARPGVRASHPEASAAGCGGGAGGNPIGNGTQSDDSFGLTPNSNGGVNLTIPNWIPGRTDPLVYPFNPLGFSPPDPTGNPLEDTALALGVGAANGLANLLPGYAEYNAAIGALNGITNLIENPDVSAGASQGLNAFVTVAVASLDAETHGAFYYGANIVSGAVGSTLPQAPGPTGPNGNANCPNSGPGGGGGSGGGGGGGGGGAGGAGGGGYIDPSGQIETPQQIPIAGARVVITRSSTATGHQVPVPAGSTLLSPGNRRNPFLTGPLGTFGWDVLPGYYQISVNRAGCRAPNRGLFARSRVTAIPPPATNLILRLRCRGLRRTVTRLKLHARRGLDGTVALRVVATLSPRRPGRGRVPILGSVTIRAGGRFLTAVALDPRSGMAVADISASGRRGQTFTATFGGDAVLAPSSAWVHVR